MDDFKRKQLREVSAWLLEENLYALVSDELSRDVRRDGLWLKAVVQAQGNEELLRSLYIEYRVQSLKDERTVELAKEGKVLTRTLSQLLGVLKGQRSGDYDERSISYHSLFLPVCKFQKDLCFF